MWFKPWNFLCITIFQMPNDILNCTVCNTSQIQIKFECQQKHNLKSTNIWVEISEFLNVLLLQHKTMYYLLNISMEILNSENPILGEKPSYNTTNLIVQKFIY